MNKFELKGTVLVDKQDILNRQHNLWIGYSFGNKWFNNENLTELVKFGLKYTKDSLLIWIPSRLYATNLNHIDDEGRAEALRRAFEAGDDKRKEIEDIVKNLPSPDQRKIIIANYDECLSLKYLSQREILLREFSKQNLFYSLVIEITAGILKSRGRTLSKTKLEAAALYTLQELPMFLDGITKNGDPNIHTVLLYPGLGQLDDLIEKIKTAPEFAKLREKLELSNLTGVADVS